jgi:hypothetical protein
MFASCISLGGSEGLQEAYLQHVEQCLTSPDVGVRLSGISVVAAINRSDLYLHMCVNTHVCQYMYVSLFVCPISCVDVCLHAGENT